MAEKASGQKTRSKVKIDKSQIIKVPKGITSKGPPGRLAGKGKQGKQGKQSSK